MTKTGQWQKMAAEIPDDVLDEFCVYTTYDELPAAIEARFGGVSDTVEVSVEDDTNPEVARDLLSKIQAIPSAFEAPRNHYA
jgi:hypothetical protein